MLWRGAETNDLELLKKVVEEVEDINLLNEQGWNAIILAAYNHNLEALKFLLLHGADINSTNPKGTTVFMYAKTKCLNTDNFKILDFLLAKGADINAKDKKAGWTVLQYVREAQDLEMLDYLVKNGAK